MIALSPNTSVITLNTNDLNASIKRQKLKDWIKKSCVQETHFQYDTSRLKK